MKVFQLAALFGGASSAVQPVVRRYDGTTTLVVYSTSTETVTKCAATITNCPVASATNMFTSTTVMSVMTMVCPVSSSPGLQPHQSGGPVPLSTALISGQPLVTNTLSDAVPTSFLPQTSSSAYIPPVRSSALPTGPLGSIDVSVSLTSPSPPLPNTNTDSVPTSFPPGVSGSSSDLTPIPTSALPTSPIGSDTIIVPRPSPSGSTSLPDSLTDSNPFSLPLEASASGSSTGYVPPQPSTTAGPISSLPMVSTTTDTVPTSIGIPLSGHGQLSTPGNIITDAVPSSGDPGSSGGPSSGTYTPSVSSVTEAIPTSGSSISSSGPNASNPLSVSSNTIIDANPSSGSPASGVGPSSRANTASISSHTEAVPTSERADFSASNSPSISHSPSASNYTATNAVPTSGHPDSSISPPSSAAMLSSPRHTATDPGFTSGYTSSSVSSSASSTGPAGTVTDSVPTSSDPRVAESSSDGYKVPETTALPNQGTFNISQSSPTGSVPVASFGSPTTASVTYPAVTSTSSVLVYPGPTLASSMTLIDGTTGITSRLTWTSTSYVTAPLPLNNASTDTATDAIPTSSGTGYVPSGSGTPYPSGANGTIIPPSPSYIEAPVNMGQIVAVGQCPIAAIVIALAFALFA